MSFSLNYANYPTKTQPQSHGIDLASDHVYCLRDQADGNHCGGVCSPPPSFFEENIAKMARKWEWRVFKKSVVFIQVLESFYYKQRIVIYNNALVDDSAN